MLGEGEKLKGNFFLHSSAVLCIHSFAGAFPNPYFWHFIGCYPKTKQRKKKKRHRWAVIWCIGSSLILLTEQKKIHAALCWPDLHPVSHPTVSLKKEFKHCVKKMPYSYTHHKFLWVFLGFENTWCSIFNINDLSIIRTHIRSEILINYLIIWKVMKSSLEFMNKWPVMKLCLADV